MAEVDAASISTVTPGEPDLWFVLPPGFFEMKLDESGEDRMLRMADAVDPMFSGTTPEQKMSLILSSEYAIESMLDAGAVHLSTCLYRRDDEGISQGMLAVFIKRLGSTQRLDIAQGIADQWLAENPEAEVGGVILPYGPAALCILEREIPVPGAMFDTTEDGVAALRQLQLALPLRSGTHTAVFAFSTEDVDQWDNYLQVIAEILRTISAEEPALEPDGATPQPTVG
ncbi:hypothetical protein AB0G54_10760 [Streptomyces yokosukanensis]|uniref:hypothetical protein n=1 Tax=Streptomyces yokosukanensis TaxID=67386 RepID=UPI0034232DCF